MSDFDPVDDWLRTDVELMHPPAGAFERVHRRARRRKAIMAASTVAAAAIVVVAAVALPQVASAFLPGHGGPDKVGQGTSTKPSRQSPSQRPSSSPKHFGPASLSPPGAGASITNSAHQPAAGFQPGSVTFVNPVVGAVIGQTSASCPAGSCTVVAGTSSYGRSWRWADAPQAGPPDGDTGVSQIRFLNPDDGWAYGPELFWTQDGGVTWTRITGLPGRVIDLATVGGSAFAVVARCEGAGSAYATGCTRFSLYSSPYDADRWQPVPGAAASLAEVPGGLQFTSTYGYLLAGGVLFTGSPGGGAWQQVTPGPGTVPACLRGDGHQPAPAESGLIAPGTSSTLYLLCQSDAGGQAAVLYQSPDAGRTWQRDGQAGGQGGGQGAATSLAVVPPGGQNGGAVVLATGSGIYYSLNARTWHQAPLGGPAPATGFSFVGMTTSANGVAVPAAGAGAAGTKAGEIYITNDGGRSWHPEGI
jgi:hypothetical protein